MCAPISQLLIGGLFLLVVDSGHCANVLGIFTFPGQSNLHFNKAILESLHDAGHRITFLTTFASSVKSSSNFTVVDVGGGIPNLVGRFTPEYAMSFSALERMRFLYTHEEKYCSHIIETPTIQEALSSKVKFDVLLTQFLFVPQCQLKIAEALRIPIIGTVAFQQEIPTMDTGNPFNPSTIPHPFSVFGDRMSFWQRLLNTWYYVASKYLDETTIQPTAMKFYRKYFPKSPTPPRISPSLVFVNSHSSLLPRPLAPNCVEVAGIHIRPPKPLDPMLEKFVTEAKNGVVLFTFGSVVLPSQMPPQAIAAFVQAFAAIPQRVIWKYDQPLEDVSDNVLLVDWIPQRDLLEHENVIAFISHCGLSGTLEAIHTATPVVAAPLFADQPANALLLEEKGAGVRISPFTSTPRQILDALNAILNNTKYSENMRKLSNRFKDRALTPKQTVAHWTEYIIRQEGAAHLRTAAADMPLYQYLLLDVILFVVSVLAIALYALYFVVATTMKRLGRKFASDVSKKKKN